MPASRTITQSHKAGYKAPLYKCDVEALSQIATNLKRKRAPDEILPPHIYGLLFSRDKLGLQIASNNRTGIVTINGITTNCEHYGTDQLLTGSTIVSVNGILTPLIHSTKSLNQLVASITSQPRPVVIHYKAKNRTNKYSSVQEYYKTTQVDEFRGGGDGSALKCAKRSKKVDPWGFGAGLGGELLGVVESLVDNVEARWLKEAKTAALKKFFADRWKATKDTPKDICETTYWEKKMLFELQTIITQSNKEIFGKFLAENPNWENQQDLGQIAADALLVQQTREQEMMGASLALDQQRAVEQMQLDHERACTEIKQEMRKMQEQTGCVVDGFDFDFDGEGMDVDVDVDVDVDEEELGGGGVAGRWWMIVEDRGSRNFG